MISFLLSVRQSVRITMVVIYVGCIAALSLLPPQDFPKVPLFDGIDKVVHFLMYFIFSLLACWAIKTELNYRRLFVVILSTIGWGIFMEIMQFSMHLGRSFDIYDILANSVGVFFGVIVYVLGSRKSLA
jgi:VanZ family protein